MKKRCMNKRNQRGVALLFALGVLSLLLVMGLAFVANSLLAQKIASNNSSRSQAKMLAQSAISRMAISLMYYQYKAAHPPTGASYTGFIPENYMDVRSHYDLPVGSSSPNTADAAATDGLRDSDSKLIPGTWLTNYDLENDLRGEWSYITARDDSDDDKIIGRIAYQLIPTTTTAQINLDHNLRGVYEQDDPEPKRIPWQTRIGTDINELNLNETEVFRNWETTHAPENEEDMEASTFDAFFTAYKDTLFATDKETKEAWVKHWFIDGTVAADPEYYLFNPSGQSSQYYHRFNLGEIDDEDGTPADEWYDRFDGLSTAGKNSKEAVEALAADSEEFKITDQLTPTGVGLPFLKSIGDSAGTFDSVRDRRRQITANLNDYCDEDSIPTSDVPAEEWVDGLAADSSIDTAWPRYTGNEKTPYINEFAFGFNINPSVENSSLPTMKIKADVKAELAAELISMYEKTPENTYTLYMGLPASEFTLTLAMKAEIEVKETDTSEPTTITVEKEVPLKFAPESETGSALDVRKMEFGSSLWKDGYALNHLELQLKEDGSDSAAAGEAVLDCSKEGISPTAVLVTLKKVRFAIKSFTFKVHGIALTREQTVDGATSEYGVDFVRWNESFSAPELVLFSDLAGYDASSGFNEATSGTFSVTDDKLKKVYLAGMQARDPRQNLNVKQNLSSDADYDADKSDWRTFSDIKWVEYDSSIAGDNHYDDGVLSMKVDFAAGTIADSFENGLVNKDVSNPSNREKDADGVVVGDYETETDPAWRTEAGAAEGDPETEHHLSTAYIRNAPMKSLWELGVIHRAKAWQTINLKSAMRPGTDDKPIRNEDMRQPGEGDTSWDGDGTSFVGGDGGLLEQVKITDKAYCYGKLNVNMFSSDTSLNPDYTTRDDEMGRALFYNIRRGQSIGDLMVADTDSFPETGTPIEWDPTSVVVNPLKEAVAQFRAAYPEYDDAFESRAQFLAWETDDGKSLANGFGIISDAEYDALLDAQREEIVGKTINLIKGNNSVSNMIRFIVVAQTIRDNTGTVARIRYDGTVDAKTDCEYGQFDLAVDNTCPADFTDNEKFLYFDEITGEVKLLVTMENNPNTGQIIVRQVEYIE